MEAQRLASTRVALKLHSARVAAAPAGGQTSSVPAGCVEAPVAAGPDGAADADGGETSPAGLTVGVGCAGRVKPHPRHAERRRLEPLHAGTTKTAAVLLTAAVPGPRLAGVSWIHGAGASVLADLRGLGAVFAERERRTASAAGRFAVVAAGGSSEEGVEVGTIAIDAADADLWHPVPADTVALSGSHCRSQHHRQETCFHPHVYATMR